MGLSSEDLAEQTALSKRRIEQILRRRPARVAARDVNVIVAVLGTTVSDLLIPADSSPKTDVAEKNRDW